MAAKKSSRKRKGSDAKAKNAKAKENHEFVAEAEDILERMFENLSDLQEQRHGDGEIDPDLVNQIFRSAHTLKGLAGMFGLETIGHLAHRLEDILDGLRLGRLSFDSPTVGLLDEGVALLATLMTRLEHSDGDDDEMRDAVGRITGSLGQQTDACSQMSEALARVSEEAHVNEEAANKIQAATRELIAHSDSLREKSERFRV